MASQNVKKVTFICQTLDIGGAEIFNTDLLTAFQKDGINVTASVTEPRLVKMLNDEGISAQRIPVILDVVGDWKGLVKAFFLFPKGVFYYWRAVRKNRDADVILLSGFTEKIMVSPIAAFYKVPVVWIEFGPISPLFKKFLGLPKFWYSLVKHFPTKIVVPSLHTLKDVVETVDIPAEKFVVIPCGRDISSVQISLFDKAKIKRNSIACVSRMEPGKGQDLLIEALSEVVQKIPSAHLFLTGDSGWKSALLKKVSLFHLEKSVTFSGRVPNSLQFMSEAEVCVFPSTWELEGFGLVTIEAMALGKPIVAFNIGPTPEIIQDHRNGFLIEKGNVKEMANQIVKLLDHQEKNVQKITEQAQKDFLEKYQIRQVAAKYKKEFLLAIAEK